MKFKDIKINQRFRFVDDPKIYTKKSTNYAQRFLVSYFVDWDREIELVHENGEENYKEIESRSYYSYLVSEEGARNPNENE